MYVCIWFVATYVCLSDFNKCGPIYINLLLVSVIIYLQLL